MTTNLGVCWVAWCRVDGRIVAVGDDAVDSEETAIEWCAKQERVRS